MRVLVIHQNFPGQFAHLVRTWSQRPGWDVRGLGRDTAPGLPGFNALTRYKPTRAVRSNQHAYLRQIEDATLHGQATARAMLAMRQTGFVPDVIVAHPGWGETLYAKDVFPDSRLVHLCEWYYSAEGADVGFDPEFPVSFDTRARIRTWNALHALNLTHCDVAVAPTQWQKSRHPDIFHPKVRVHHEGIATHELGPDPDATVTTPSGVVLGGGDIDRPVLTYVARNLEPYRGFHVFMRVLERIQRIDPRCHALIVGGDEVSYGQRPPATGSAKSGRSGSWREHMLSQVNLDPTRTHFMGRLPREQYLRVLQVSNAHVYLTYPFVLSWSLLEAMACGTPIVASDTAPVREVLRDGENARLVDFFNADAIADAAIETMHSESANVVWRMQAMADAQDYGLSNGLGGYDALLGLAPRHETTAPPAFDLVGSF
ncbi:MAG: glycosyl transferase family 1 [Burkholderiales bacterium PBB1]|nr:MAG: glycosyl transferase family 1 [Burkholderiales bacterium PBB1]